MEKVSVNSPYTSPKAIMNSKQLIRGAVRVRPIVEDDYSQALMHQMLDVCVGVKSDKKTVVVTKDAFESKQIEFDYAFNPLCDTSFLYGSCCADIVADVFRGYNGCIMAYGQTGISGISYFIIALNS
jgi:hypothetical protein